MNGRRAPGIRSARLAINDRNASRLAELDRALPTADVIDALVEDTNARVQSFHDEAQSAIDQLASVADPNTRARLIEYAKRNQARAAGEILALEIEIATINGDALEHSARTAWASQHERPVPANRTDTHVRQVVSQHPDGRLVTGEPQPDTDILWSEPERERGRFGRLSAPKRRPIVRAPEPSPAELNPWLSPDPLGAVQWADVEGLNIAYRRMGDDPNAATVLLLHGSGSRGQVWYEHAIELRTLGYNVVIPDLPGFGESDFPNSYELQDYADVMMAFTREIGLENFDVHGNSHGGTVALWMLAQNPEVVGHVHVMNPAGPPTRLAHTWNAQAGKGKSFFELLKPNTPLWPVGLPPIRALQTFVGGAKNDNKHVDLAHDIVVTTHADVGPLTASRVIEEMQENREIGESPDRAYALRQLARSMIKDYLRVVGLWPGQSTYDVIDGMSPDVQQRISMTTAEDDRVVAFETDLALAERMPYARLLVTPGGGHTPNQQSPAERFRTALRLRTGTTHSVGHVSDGEFGATIINEIAGRAHVPYQVDGGFTAALADDFRHGELPPGTITGANSPYPATRRHPARQRPPRSA